MIDERPSTAADLVRDDGSTVTAEHVLEIQAIARIEAARIVRDEREDPTPVDGDGDGDGDGEN